MPRQRVSKAAVDTGIRVDDPCIERTTESDGDTESCSILTVSALTDDVFARSAKWRSVTPPVNTAPSGSETMIRRILSASLAASLAMGVAPTLLAQQGSISGRARSEARRPYTDYNVQLVDMATKQLTGTVPLDDQGVFAFPGVAGDKQVPGAAVQPQGEQDRLHRGPGTADCAESADQERRQHQLRQAGGSVAAGGGGGCGDDGRRGDSERQPVGRGSNDDDPDGPLRSVRSAFLTVPAVRTGFSVCSRRSDSRLPLANDGRLNVFSVLRFLMPGFDCEEPHTCRSVTPHASAGWCVCAGHRRRSASRGSSLVRWGMTPRIAIKDIGVDSNPAEPLTGARSGRHRHGCPWRRHHLRIGRGRLTGKTSG